LSVIQDAALKCFAEMAAKTLIYSAFLAILYAACRFVAKVTLIENLSFVDRFKCADTAKLIKAISIHHHE